MTSPDSSGAPCPEGRLSQPTAFRDGLEILNLDAYVPFFLAAVNNALSRGASGLYRSAFGIGIVDWRVIGTLAIEPGATAGRICEVIALDKGATSRSLQFLSERGYLTHVATGKDSRKRRWWLNDSGYALHGAVLNLALERERRLVRNVAPPDLEVFLRVMRIMRANLDTI